MHGRAACQRRARRPQRIIGHGNQHLIADIEQRMHGETDELGHAIADDDVLERHTFDVFALRVMHDGFARTKNPFGVGITRRERKIFGQILLHLLRHGEVKSGQITDVQLDDARTFRFHLAGFMAAPETLLGEGRDQLAIPDSPAPYEVVQLSSNIDAQDFYRKYTQARQLEVEYDAICEAMENGNSTVEVQADELEAQIMAIADELRGNLCAQNDVRVPIEKLYMVVPEKDLEDWLRVLVRCASKPAGIVAYDDTTVRLEDFASDHKGDGDELARQLRGIVGETAETLTYADVLGSEFNDSMRYGDANQLIGPKYLANTKRIVMENGKLVVKE